MFLAGNEYYRDDSLSGLHNVRGVERICEYRDSRKNLKPFTGGGFSQSMIETDKFQTWDLPASPNNPRCHQGSVTSKAKT